MNSFYKDIIKDDPELSQYKKRIQSLLSDFPKPEISLDPEFEKKLQRRLSMEMVEKKEQYIEKKLTNKAAFQLKMKYSLGGFLTAFCAVVFLVLIGFLTVQPNQFAIDVPVQYTWLDSQAFGQLPKSDSDLMKFESSLDEADGEIISEEIVMDELFQTSEMKASSKMTSEGTIGQDIGIVSLDTGKITNENGYSQNRLLGAISPSSLLPANPNYLYTYSSKKFPKLEESGNVYRQSQTNVDSYGVSNLVNALHLEGINFRKYQDLGMQYLSLKQDEPYGYLIDIDFGQGTISLNKNYDQWPEEKEITEFPSEKTLRKTIDAQLKTLGVSLEGYGDAEFFDYGNDSYGVTVLYPALIDGKQIYDPSLPFVFNSDQKREATPYSKIGMHVRYSLGEERIESISNLKINSYDVSSYPLITDKEAILTDASKGGDYNMKGENTIGTTKEINLNEPQQVYLSLREGVSDHYFVPALLFTVQETDAGYRGLGNIFVSLLQ